jgi:hypothetical protein
MRRTIVSVVPLPWADGTKFQMLYSEYFARADWEWAVHKKLHAICCLRRPSAVSKNIVYCPFTDSGILFSFYLDGLGPLACFPNRINLELSIWRAVLRTPWTGDQSCITTATYIGQRKQKKYGQTWMPQVGFETIIQVLSCWRHFMP